MTGDGVLDLYRQELPLSFNSAFVTHGLSTWAVLLGGWVFCCLSIDFLVSISWTVRASKLQCQEKTDDAALRSLAKRVVIRNWLAVLVQTIVFAPVLKLAFPLHRWRSAMSLWEYVAFIVVWFVMNDLIFTMFHVTFHRYPWLYKLVHKEHHTWKAPFAWMSHAMSIYELSANATSVMFVPVCHSLWLGRTTPLELIWFVQLWSQLIGCIEHSGYGAINPLAPLVCLRSSSDDGEEDGSRGMFPKWLFSTTKHHDDHHKYFNGNYGGYLAVWDVMMGTVLTAKEDKKER